VTHENSSFSQNPSPKTQELPVNKPGAEPAERVVAMSMLSEAEIELLISALYTLEMRTAA